MDHIIRKTWKNPALLLLKMMLANRGSGMGQKFGAVGVRPKAT